MLRFIQRVAHSIYKNNTNVVNREIEDFIIRMLPLERHQISKFYSNPAHDGEKAYDYKLDGQELDINQQIIAGRVIKWFFGEQTMKQFAKLIKRGKTAEALNANIVPDDNPYKSDKLDVTEWRKI